MTLPASVWSSICALACSCFAPAEEHDGDAEGQHFAALNTRTLGALLAAQGAHLDSVLRCAGHAGHAVLCCGGLGALLDAQGSHADSCAEVRCACCTQIEAFGRVSGLRGRNLHTS